MEFSGAWDDVPRKFPDPTSTLFGYCLYCLLAPLLVPFSQGKPYPAFASSPWCKSPTLLFYEPKNYSRAPPASLVISQKTIHISFLRGHKKLLHHDQTWKTSWEGRDFSSVGLTPHPHYRQQGRAPPWCCNNCLLNQEINCSGHLQLWPACIHSCCTAKTTWVFLWRHFPLSLYLAQVELEHVQLQGWYMSQAWAMVHSDWFTWAQDLMRVNLEDF